MGFIQNAINQAIGSVIQATQKQQSLIAKNSRMAKANLKAAVTADKKSTQKKQYRSYKKALFAQPDIMKLGESAKKSIYEQTKTDKQFKTEVLNKYYGNKK